MNNETPITATQDLLADVNVEFEYASTGQRFLNFLIDYLFVIFGLGFLLGIVLGLLGRADLYESGSKAFWYFVFISLYVGYYTLCELVFKGRTLGKLLTGTRAVRTNNEALTFKDAFLRSVSRLVPFEVFSGFGNPWHDSWTDTMVIKAR